MWGGRFFPTYHLPHTTYRIPPTTYDMPSTTFVFSNIPALTRKYLCFL